MPSSLPLSPNHRPRSPRSSPMTPCTPMPSALATPSSVLHTHPQVMTPLFLKCRTSGPLIQLTIFSIRHPMITLNYDWLLSRARCRHQDSNQWEQMGSWRDWSRRGTKGRQPRKQARYSFSAEWSGKKVSRCLLGSEGASLRQCSARESCYLPRMPTIVYYSRPCSWISFTKFSIALGVGVLSSISMGTPAKMPSTSSNLGILSLLVFMSPPSLKSILTSSWYLGSYAYSSSATSFSTPHVRFSDRS